MAKKKKYYVVWKGVKPGIYNTWDDCLKQVSAFPAAQYKAFESMQEAQEAFNKPFKPKEKESKLPLSKLIGKPNLDSLSVDAACSGNPGVLEYRGVHTSNGESIFEMGPFPEGTVNIGEFLAIVHALALCKKHNYTKPIYSDSKTAMSWVKKKKANTKLERNKKNEKLFDLIDRAEAWLQQNNYLNPIWKWETKYWGEIPADYGRK